MNDKQKSRRRVGEVKRALGLCPAPGKKAASFFFFFLNELDRRPVFGAL